jgi:hypothetical protein
LGSLTPFGRGQNTASTPNAFSAWQTVDNYQYTLNDNAEAFSLAANSAGMIYATGWGYDPSMTRHSLVQASGDGGGTWSLLNDYTTFDGASISMAVDPNGILYQSAAAILTPGAKNSWVTRQSIDQGATWTVVDDFTLGGAIGQPTSVATDSGGNVYVAGFALPASGYEQWIIRKGTPTVGGMNWTTVDQLASSAGGEVARGVVCHPAAGVFAIGQTVVTGKKTSTSVWTVRRSQDGGVTWQTVDTYSLNSSQQAWGNGLGIDEAGNLYAVGTAGNSTKGFYDWIVRKSSDAGTSWTTVDDVTASGIDNTANAFTGDAKGNLYVVGQSRSPAINVNTWIVRESVGGTGAWTTVDSYQLVTGKSATATTAMSALGQVLVAGYATDGTANHWIVRRFMP